MEPRIIKDVVISSNPTYQKFEESENIHVFTYTITIENQSMHSLQLVERFWEIGDGLDWKREVHGEGVVGEKPIMHPTERHTYESWCPSPSKFTYMKGYYVFKNLETGEMFKAEIPQMNLVVPDQLN